MKGVWILSDSCRVWVTLHLQLFWVRCARILACFLKLLRIFSDTPTVDASIKSSTWTDFLLWVRRFGRTGDATRKSFILRSLSTCSLRTLYAPPLMEFSSRLRRCAKGVSTIGGQTVRWLPSCAHVDSAFAFHGATCQLESFIDLSRYPPCNIYPHYEDNGIETTLYIFGLFTARQVVGSYSYKYKHKIKNRAHSCSLFYLLSVKNNGLDWVECKLNVPTRAFLQTKIFVFGG